jgi:hypothetical protein
VLSQSKFTRSKFRVVQSLSATIIIITGMVIAIIFVDRDSISFDASLVT